MTTGADGVERLIERLRAEVRLGDCDDAWAHEFFTEAADALAALTEESARLKAERDEAERMAREWTDIAPARFDMLPRAADIELLSFALHLYAKGLRTKLDEASRGRAAAEAEHARLRERLEEAEAKLRQVQPLIASEAEVRCVEDAGRAGGRAHGAVCRCAARIVKPMERAAPTGGTER